MHDIFYFTDVHGCYDLYRAAMNYCLEQDPECTIIFGGDACDRGRNGYKIMKELLIHPQVVYLMGNHENMFIHAAMIIKSNYTGAINYDDTWDYLYQNELSINGLPSIQHCINNGGFNTLHDWMMDGMPTDILSTLYKLPLTFSLDKLDFCHAGGDPKVFARVNKDEYNNELPDEEDRFMMLWDRNWTGFGWMPERTCIFGHTPTPYLPAKYYGKDKSIAKAHPCKYVGLIDPRLTGARLAMDTGAFASGKLYVLNCLTMKAQGFVDKDYQQDENHEHHVEKIEVIQF